MQLIGAWSRAESCSKPQTRRDNISVTVSDKTEEIMFKFHKQNYIYGTRFLPEYFVKTGITQPNKKILFFLSFGFPHFAIAIFYFFDKNIWF